MLIRWPLWVVCATLSTSVVNGADANLDRDSDLRRRTTPPPIPSAAGNSQGWQTIARARASMDQLRSLLLMDADARKKSLAGKSAEKRSFLLAQLREFDALAPAEREARLEALELRGYLVRLMKMNRAERATAIAAVPEPKRAAVEDRLQRWDRLPQDLQKDVLEHERTMYYVLRLHSTTPAPGGKVAVPKGVKERWDEKVEEWQALPPERRHEVSRQFHRFFELSQKERARVLQSLSDQERRRTEESLRAFEELSPEERQACLDSLHKLVEMPAENREQIQRTLDRWKAMPAREKRLWKDVTTVLPPMPPGFEATPPLPVEGTGRAAPSGTNMPAPLAPGVKR